MRCDAWWPQAAFEPFKSGLRHDVKNGYVDPATKIEHISIQVQIIRSLLYLTAPI